MTNTFTCAYTHINVAIVTRSHFGNAKPKFHMNCWPTISINDRSCQQRCRANFLMCSCAHIHLYSLYTKVMANSRGMHTRTVIFTHSETHRTKLIISRTAYLLLRSAYGAGAKINNIWLANASHPRPPLHLSALLVRNVFVLTRCFPEG